MSELQTLQSEWLRIDGAEMPDDIADNPIEIVRKAVHWRRQGVVGIIPKTPVSVPVSADESQSIIEWDSSDESKLNAYGQ